MKETVAFFRASENAYNSILYGILPIKIEFYGFSQETKKCNLLF